MTKTTTAERLNQIMSERKLKQVDILEMCKPFCNKFGVKLNKNDLSQYVSGKVMPKQDKLSILALALDVNEVWLMGYDLPPERNELIKSENKFLHGISPFEAIKNQYGIEVGKVLQLFIQLDEMDRSRIIERMETMLENEKYQKGLDEKAI